MTRRAWYSLALARHRVPSPASAPSRAGPRRISRCRIASPTPGTGQIEVLPVQGSVYMLAGAGSNVTVQVGPTALFVVDTNVAAMSDKILAAIKTISPLPIRSIVNTSADPDHVGGNERFAKSAGDSVNGFFQQGARVYAQDNAYARMTNPKDGSAALPAALWPTDVFAAPLKSFFVTGEPIEIIHQPAAHTNGDLMVFFRKSDVISAGDIFVTNGYPVIDAKHGGTLQGVLDGLNRLIDHRDPRIQLDGRHAHHSRARPDLERDRSGRVPRCADDHRRSDHAARARGQDGRAGQGRRRQPRFRRRLRRHQRAVDDGHVRGDGLPRDQGEHGAVEGAPAAQRAGERAAVPQHQQPRAARSPLARPRRSGNRAAIRSKGTGRSTSSSPTTSQRASRRPAAR